jgi:CBS domain-containing protein
MLVKNILTHSPATAAPDATVLSVSEMMREDDTGAVIILDEGRVVGIVTDRDITTQLPTCDKLTLARPVSEIMTLNPLTCFDDQNVVDAAVIMADHQVRRLPVMNRGNQLVGMLTVDLIAENYSEKVAGETLGEIVESRLRKPRRSDMPNQ